jgi:hypothetical protein
MVKKSLLSQNFPVFSILKKKNWPSSKHVPQQKEEEAPLQM